MKSKGYTLIEVLVVLTIIGVLFSVGFASYRDFSRRQALAGIAKQIVGEMRLAQQMALSGEKPSACGNNVLDGIGFEIKLLTQDSKDYYNYKIRAVCGGEPYPILKDYSFPAGSVIFDFSNFSINPIIFKVLGQGTNIPDGIPDRLLLKDLSNNSYEITVDSGGVIK